MIKQRKGFEVKAINLVMSFERGQGRNPKNVSKTGCGFDIKSKGRRIEVKGVSEKWSTYTWQSLYPSEVYCLNKFTNNFYLYIVKFNPENEKNIRRELYIIPGKDLKRKFKIRVSAYSLTPISKRNLKRFKSLKII